jgi:hypothetical protein
LIGCEYTTYAKQGLLEQLPGCHEDVKNITQLLVQKYHYDPLDIHILCDDDNDENVTRQPTRINIETKLKTLFSHYDQVVVYYSGHGTQQPDMNQDEVDDNLDECLVPCDFRTAGFLVDDTLKQMIFTSSTISKKIFFLIDACHSATMLDLPYNENNSMGAKEVMNSENVNQPFVLSLSGCRDNQTSASAILEKRWQGALSYSLLHVLQEDRLSLHILLTLLKKELTTLGFSQTPQLCYSQPINTNTFLFSL